jgi:DNA-binding transcriptional LysR family regulator
MDLNDLRYFALIVEHGGFSAAERETRVPRSKLSRRIARLEQRLGALLLQRSTRRLALTDAGQAFYAHCRAMLVEAEAAEAAVGQLYAEPAGTVRLTSPVVIAQLYLAPLIAGFMVRHPKVRVELDATDRTLNLIEDRVDIAVRARESAMQEPGLVARRIGSGRLILVASPSYLDGLAAPPSTSAPVTSAASTTLAASATPALASTPSMPVTPEQLAQCATIGSRLEGEAQNWTLRHRDGGSCRVTHRPRLLCSDFSVQYEAAISGVGIALLPERVARRGLRYEALRQVLPDWGTAEESIHLVIATRRGLMPAVRALLDYLAVELPRALGG